VLDPEDLRLPEFFKAFYPFELVSDDVFAIMYSKPVVERSLSPRPRNFDMLPQANFDRFGRKAYIAIDHLRPEPDTVDHASGRKFGGHKTCGFSDQRLQHAADAIFHLSALQGHLTQADVVQRLDPLAPGVDLRLVDVARGGGVLEEQRQAQPLVHVLGGRGVGVDDLLVADLVRVLVVLQVVVGQERRRVVDAADLAFLADLDLAGHRVDRTGRVVDVGDRPRRRNRLQVLVVDAVRLHRLLQPHPILLRRNANVRIGEQLAHSLGCRLPHLIGVLVEELS